MASPTAAKGARAEADDWISAGRRPPDLPRDGVSAMQSSGR